jgi:hypothetical protein
MKTVVNYNFLELCLFSINRNSCFFRPQNQNYLGCSQEDFIDKILRHPRNRYLDYFMNFGVEIYVKMLYSRNFHFEFKDAFLLITCR